MSRFQYATDRYPAVKTELDKLDQAFLFATMDETGSIHLTENLGDQLGNAELWMVFLGSLFSVGVDTITAELGAPAARAFVARSHNTLERLIEDPDFGVEPDEKKP